MSPKHSTSGDGASAPAAAGSRSPAAQAGSRSPAAQAGSRSPAAQAGSRSPATHPTIHPNGTEPSIGSLVSTVSQSFSDLVQGEIELAKIEIKASVKNAGTGAGMFAAAAVLLVFASIFGFIALAEGLVAAHIWRWAAYLIVFGALVLVALLAALLGWRKVKRVRAPKETIATTKDSVIAVKRAASSS